MTVDFRVSVGEGMRASAVSARLYEPAGDSPAWLVLAPGAGAGHDSRFMVAFARGLASRALHVVTFNFPYVEHGRRVPDPTATLEACWVAVLSAVRERAGPGARLFAGGKSMGGRIASQVAARDPSGLRGLVFLGYPLHPPGRSDQRRTAHWPAIRVPGLFIQGSRDPFAAPDELRENLRRFGADSRLLIVKGGNHSLEVPRGSGRSQDEINAEVQEAIAGWVREHAGT